MNRYENAASTDAVEDFAFAHLSEMASLLHRSGHRDMAALLDSMGDIRELSRRRANKGGTEALIGPGSETLDYVLAQMSDLVKLMDANGMGDAALLFRIPGRLAAASEVRTDAAAPHGEGASIHYILPAARTTCTVAEPARLPGDAWAAVRNAG